MDSRPPHLLLLLLTGLLHLWHCARGQSSYIIDNVGLRVLPGNTVQSGTVVTLQCQVRVSHNNIPHLTHTFQLRRNDVVVHSETTAEDSITYALSPARAADSGSYDCLVKVKERHQTSHSQKLDVTGLQTPILYLNKTQPHENEEFTATCSAPDEKGSLNFRFYQRYWNGEARNIKQPAATGNSVETTLVLRAVGDYFLYCDYEIILVSGARRSNRSAEIPVLVKGLYIQPVMNVLPSSEVFEGEIMEVVCKVVTHLRDVNVYLIRDRRILKQAKVALSYTFTVRDGNSGEFVCKAEWGSVQKETYKVIKVKELFSKPVLSVQPEDIFEGDHFKLTCSVSIYVPDKVDNGTMSFSISRDNINLTSSDTYDSLATPSRNGNYTCKVSTSILGIEKNSPAVVVKAKVPVSRPELSVVGGTVVLGKPFQLRCNSSRGTLPIVYTLHGLNRAVQRREVRRPGEQAVFNCSAVFKTSDVSNFLCHARNGQHRTETGQVSRSTVVIEPVTKPVLKIVPGGGDVSEGQNVILVCSVQKGSFPINFTLYQHNTGLALVSKTSWKREEIYKISNVRGKDQGGYYCVCNNPADKAEQSLTFTITVKMAGWKKGLIAALCILLILALILVLVFKKRLIRFKRKATVELPVKSVGTKAERLSLTQAEVNQANATPGMMGKSVWSEHVSGSESDDQNSLTSPENPEPQYTEVQTRQADPSRAPVKKGTDTVYSEVRNSKHGAPEQPDAASVEYAQLNHDGEHHGERCNHGDRGAQEAGAVEIDSSVDNGAVDAAAADQGE